MYRPGDIVEVLVKPGYTYQARVRAADMPYLVFLADLQTGFPLPGAVNPNRLTLCKDGAK